MSGTCQVLHITIMDSRNGTDNARLCAFALTPARADICQQASFCNWSFSCDIGVDGFIGEREEDGKETDKCRRKDGLAHREVGEGTAMDFQVSTDLAWMGINKFVTQIS